MHVLAIVGSCRVNGNTDILIDEVLNGVRSSGGTIDKVYLSDLDIKPCIACHACLKKQQCCIEDDMQGLTEKILAADGIVLGSPVYWNCVSGQMKMFIDRCLVFLNEKFESVIAGKNGAIISVCGASDIKMCDLTSTVMRDFLKFNHINIIDEIKAAGLTNPGDALKNDKMMSNAFKAGRKFFN